MIFCRFRWPLLLAVLLLLAGCDSSFEPYAETDQSFSLFGFLDATRGQHPVRVEPLQDDRPLTADSTIDATATLTHLGSGRQVTLAETRLSSRGGFRHNFVADMDLQLNETYRLAVRRSSDGKASTATVTIPHEIPELSLSEQGLSAAVEGGVKDKLLYLRVIYYVSIQEMTGLGRVYPDSFEAQYARRARRTETGYAASFDWAADVDSLYSGPVATVTLTGVEVQVALAHPNAPDYDGLSYEELFRPGVAPSNVENGYGFVAGITSDEASVTIPPGERPKISVGG